MHTSYHTEMVESSNSFAACRVFMEWPRFVSFREGKILIELTCRDYICVLRNSGTRQLFFQMTKNYINALHIGR